MIRRAKEARRTGRRGGLLALVKVALPALMLFPLAPSVGAQKAKPAPAPYVPPAGGWERRSPSAVGVDSVKLADAVAFAISKESKSPRDLELNHLQTFGREPLGDAIGPLPKRSCTWAPATTTSMSIP